MTAILPASGLGGRRIAVAFRDATPEVRARVQTAAFTLIEMLLVIATILVVMGLAAPAFNALKGAGDVTKAAYDVAGVIEAARSYAMANNTYTWVGFYEEDAGTLIPTAVKPPYAGKGRLVMAVVYSKDGTTGCQDPNSTSGTPIPLAASMLGQLGKLVKVENVHMTDIGAPAGGNAQTLDGRPDLPYTYNSPVEYQNRINSDDTHTPTNATKYPFVIGGYTFWKTIRFNPRGEANINSTYSLRPVAEIGLQPTRGTTPDAAGKNVAAIQLTGIAGNVKIYRR